MRRAGVPALVVAPNPPRLNSRFVVALDRLTVPKLEAVMRAIQRPLNPHVVEAHVITELLDRVYGAS